MIKVVPAIIAESLDDLQKQVAHVAPFVDLVQVDIMDGKFAPSMSWPFTDNKLSELDSLHSKEELLGESNISYELDVMVEEPLGYLDSWAQIGVGTFILHVESVNDIGASINLIQEKGMPAALALIPSTPNEVLDEWIEHLNFVQFMGNNKIGYHNVPLDETVLGKITALRARYPEVTISVDIGVNFETAPRLIKAGANKLVSGSSIFNSDNIKEAIEGLQNITT